MLLGTRYCLMRQASGAKPIARFREGVVPTALQNLHHCPLNQSIQHRWDAKLSHPLRPVSGFPPDAPVAVDRSHSVVVPGWLSNAASGSPRKSSTVIPSTPGLPPFPFTRLNACQRFSRWQTLSIHCSSGARPSALRFAIGASVPSDDGLQASLFIPLPKASSSWFFCRFAPLSRATYLPLLLFRPSSTVPGSA
jgi:hypothetical protein